MSEVWIVNASPLIVLAKIGLVGVLPQLATEVLIPAEVAEEIGRAGAGDPAVQAI